MMENEQSAETARNEPQDRGEAVTLMEPMLIQHDSRQRDELADLALELTARSTALRHSLPDGVVCALATLVRSMNCYYSNLIEGHDTHPIDIERALNDDYSQDPIKRDLQLEARAHISVQQWIDDGEGVAGQATSADNIFAMHRRFCELLPKSLLQVEPAKTGERIDIAPGALRQRDVQVGRHVAVSPGALPRFLVRFEHAYARLGKVDAIVGTAAAHHRLLWMHPFLDGNGRVARLMSNAMLRDALDTGGIWSIARGLARNDSVYKAHLANCDLPRRNDLDGRGQLSERALSEFAHFFLTTCIDQVKFIEVLIQPEQLHARIKNWAAEQIRLGALPDGADIILESALYRGEVPRGAVAGLVGASERSARRVTAALLKRGVVVAQTQRKPLRLAFPATLASRWMPGLFPDKV